jgi:hypothetical protein
MSNMPVPLYRKYNNTDHFYTTDKTETGGGTYRDEKIECYVYSSQVDGTVPLYRRNNGSEHFYTTDKAETGGGTYRDERIECYVYPSRRYGTVPLHRNYNGSEHFYTIDPEESLPSYHYEKTACYVRLSAESDSFDTPISRLAIHIKAGNEWFVGTDDTVSIGFNRLPPQVIFRGISRGEVKIKALVGFQGLGFESVVQ